MVVKSKIIILNQSNWWNQFCSYFDFLLNNWVLFLILILVLSDPSFSKLLVFNFLDELLAYFRLVSLFSVGKILVISGGRPLFIHSWLIAWSGVNLYWGFHLKKP